MAATVDHELALPGGATLRLAVSSASDRGRVRRVNEDSYLAEPPLFLVADGMGGHSFGDRASQAAVAAFSSLSGVGALSGGDALHGAGALPSPERVLEAIRAANDAVVALSADDDESVCGTTLAGIALVEVGLEPRHHWMAFNVGDSRVYSWDGRTLEQVTVDHSAVQEMLDLGQISPVEAIEHPHRNVVTRALGVGDLVDPDIWLLPVTGRQRFLVCSDGLSKELDDDQIAAILADISKLFTGQGIADRLVDAALAAGGSDNVTVVMVESELVGSADAETDDTQDRGSMSRLLEQTRPRK